MDEVSIHARLTVFPLSAVAFVRRMRGGAQSSLLRASDGALYVVKLHGNPQGPNVLANEALGSWLAAQLGLETPAWRQISISDEFLAQNPEMWFETPSWPGRALLQDFTMRPGWWKPRAKVPSTRSSPAVGSPAFRIAKTF